MSGAHMGAPLIHPHLVSPIEGEELKSPLPRWEGPGEGEKYKGFSDSCLVDYLLGGFDGAMDNGKTSTELLGKMRNEAFEGQDSSSYIF